MKIYKIIPVLFLLFVHNAGLLADELFEKPDKLEAPSSFQANTNDHFKEEPVNCTWDYNTPFIYSATKASGDNNIATKAYIYGYNNEWADVETSNELVEEQKLDLDDQNNTPYVKLNPKKLKSFSKLYVLFVSYVKDESNNLITNPGFEDPWDWTSQAASLMSGYEPVEPGSHGLMNGEGKYTIDKTLDKNNNASNYICSEDHPSGIGKFFIANGSTRTDVDLRVWSQTLNRTLLSGKYYAFSAWVMNWADDTYRNPPKLQFYTSSINNGNQPLGNKMIVKEGDQCIWKQISAIKQPETNQDITALFLLNEEKAGDGNDFGLDDLYFGEVKKIYQLYTIDIGKYFDPEVISVALCPTLLPTDKQNLDGVKEYIADKLKLDDINKLETKATALGDNMEFEYKEDCDNDQYTSKKIKVTYTETPKKEWQPRTNQQNNTP